MKPNTTQFQ